MTAAPPRCSEAADARPERARPSTATFWLRNWVTSIIGSPQLQRGEPGDRQDRSDDPEADDDCCLLPALLLEMMVQRRVFRMAPLHHHFEKKGWQEATIVIRFWI